MQQFVAPQKIVAAGRAAGPGSRRREQCFEDEKPPGPQAFAHLGKQAPVEVQDVDELGFQTFFRPTASCAASLSASIMDCGLARPSPALPKAVPWSTDTRMIGSPSVTFTPAI